MTRRDFMTRCLACYGLSVLPAYAKAPQKRLIVIFLRGAMDGLSMVVPQFEPYYYEARPTIAIRNPLTLERDFGLHPSLPFLHDLWQNHHLSFIPACGLSKPNRSHFEAQDLMEKGVGTHDDRLTTGWLGRLSQLSSHPLYPLENIAFSPTVPTIFLGAKRVTTSMLKQKPGQQRSQEQQQIEEAFERLYKGEDPLSRLYQQASENRRMIQQDLDKSLGMDERGSSTSLAGFAKDGYNIGRLMRSDERIGTLFLSLGGWDTHTNQGDDQGALANKFGDLSRGLEAMVEALGETFRDTLIVMMTEFGRTVKENGSKGTDHGWGSVMTVIGGEWHGGHIEGVWPGLDPAVLADQRDLVVANDYREVIARALGRHWGETPKKFQSLFPTFPLPMT